MLQNSSSVWSNLYILNTILQIIFSFLDNYLIRGKYFIYHAAVNYFPCALGSITRDQVVTVLVKQNSSVMCDAWRYRARYVQRASSPFSLYRYLGLKGQKGGCKNLLLIARLVLHTRGEEQVLCEPWGDHRLPKGFWGQMGLWIQLYFLPLVPLQ